MVGILVDIFSIYRCPTTNIAAANTTVNSALAQLVDFVHSTSISQWPKNNHNRMITGIGTPISQSRSPRPICRLLQNPWIQNAKGDVGFRPERLQMP